MSITEHAIGDAIVLDVHGALFGFEVGDLLARTVDRLGRAGWQMIVASLEHVPTMDAGGLGALLEAYKASVQHGATLRFAHATPRVRLLITLSRLGQVLTTFDSITDALAESPSATAGPMAAPASWHQRLPGGPPPAALGTHVHLRSVRL